ncbi:MAG: SDR family oxidoreductase [Sphingobium sp.]|jgi:3(or 17)beta-hydroxysteroid dehydrogenase|nr:SDR family oxidoreductase [Sphingobium sp.]MCI1270779.1 SDR family oxidoreductase [Sphingobium sp.]MCI1756391.1 SDR family oxidoreductase [Sphingobium sp.]MCI2051914.1 SDR family oxidoreductase [Sphingobium sp.]
MGRLEGRTAIVTGGASGIGEATVKLFIEEGCNVVIADRNEAMGNALAAQLGDRAHFMELDVRSEDDWKRVVSGTVAAFGGLNILVNCAGYGIMTNIETTTLDQWHEMFAVHADGAFLGSKYSLPEMVKSGNGSIINISSCAAMFGYSVPMPYAAAKAAVHGMTRSIATHCRDNGYPVRCNVVMPGSVRTPLLVEAIRGWGADMESERTKKYIASLGSPRDMAGPILFLASDDGRYVNGEELLADGGKDRAGITHQSRVLDRTD